MISPAWLASLIEKLNPAVIRREVSATLFITRSSAIVDVLFAEGDAGSISLPFRPILKRAAETRTRQILLVHTHPSGDPRPSAQDIVATRRFCTLLRRQDIRLMDHLILTQNHYFSFRSHRML